MLFFFPQVNFPYAWQPSIIPIQILRVGQLVITSLPGEFTTMSGRRVRDALTNVSIIIRVYLRCISSGKQYYYKSNFVFRFESWYDQSLEHSTSASACRFLLYPFSTLVIWADNSNAYFIKIPQKRWITISGIKRSNRLLAINTNGRMMALSVFGLASRNVFHQVLKVCNPFLYICFVYNLNGCWLFRFIKMSVR